MDTTKLTQEEIKQCQDDVLRQLDVQEMSTGDLTLTALLGYFNNRPVHGRIMMSEEHANWLQEVLLAEEEGYE